MGYVIRYDCGESHSGSASSRCSRLTAMTAGFLLAFLLLTKLFWPEGSAMLRQFLIPGDPDVTSQAVSVLVDELRAGKPMGDTVQAFCAEILNHAEFPD